MEFDPTNSHQNTIKTTNRARFRHDSMIPSQQESSYSNRLNSSDMASSSGTQGIKKMKLDSSKSEVVRSVVTGEVSVHKRRSDSNTTLQENRSSKKPLFNMIPSTQTATMSTIEEQSVHNGNRGCNFAEFSERPSFSTADEETKYSGRRSSGFQSLLKPSTTTTMPGEEEKTVYNGKRGGSFLFLKNSMVSFQEQSNRDEENMVQGGVRATEIGSLKQSGQGDIITNVEANNRSTNGVNQASTSGSGQKRRREMFETIRVPAVSSRQSEMPQDGYIWWKYGERRIKGSPHPRSYYKCTTQKEKCLATKQVMRALDNPSMLEVTYKKSHTHLPLENSINITPHSTSQPDTNHLPAPLENETRVISQRVSNFDINLPAPLENEMHVIPHAVSNFDMNLPVPLENYVTPHEISNFDINLPVQLENEMHVDSDDRVVLADELTVDAPQFFEFL